ncbi:hypothetical protein PoB_005909500 [Plakobranchus ocellatus]|uniref:Uncharacterized protein n=1 Tax=Plakobranchus ocellatus TaxID=259542 RepID=A0AAV4CIB0_9GAST|nr:hypothetical protein PoB_005909500 [Plakobranchus ocellatus]
MTGLEPATERSPQISWQFRYPLCHQRLRLIQFSVTLNPQGQTQALMLRDWSKLVVVQSQSSAQPGIGYDAPVIAPVCIGLYLVPFVLTLAKNVFYTCSILMSMIGHLQLWEQSGSVAGAVVRKSALRSVAAQD